MAKKIIGTCPCPECGMGGAEVKETKAGLAYRWCPECNAQYFPRCEATSARLLEKCGIKPEPVREREPEPELVNPVMAPVQVAKPQRKPVANPFDMFLKKATA
ncbi:hypothetical protein KUF54_07110 [Comamonas sp. Y33R10-2]|uniref:hypothetical protein n=1 Tax=Comamonas sp. Y33R10-2 TaxID=2853257 RepID=UPI001C5C8F57|nr:hypothetical protein [Comamonas sp. Y33R10-2]QXZ10955.1 hypothetical protein KUF54_07110 [Comamonas sp. Y33R10-2]